MNEQQRKAIIQETFNTVSSGYDGLPLRFFPESAGLLAKSLGLRGDEHVLDRRQRVLAQVALPRAGVEAGEGLAANAGDGRGRSSAARSGDRDRLFGRDA